MDPHETEEPPLPGTCRETALRGGRLPGLALFVLTALLALPAARAASPSLSIITPRGGQRGVELDLVFHGARLSDAQEILFYSTGIEVLKLAPLSAKQVKARVKIAPDCRLGEHAARLRTATGITDLRTFYVGALPALEEKEPNSDFASPQRIELDVTVAGIVQNEDVDYFAFEARKGQRVSAEIEAMRLGQAIFDPYIALMDSRRFELSVCDDAPLLWQDAACQVVIPEDGTYVVQVRESAYGGNGNCRYRLHVGTFPRPTAIYPAGGPPGAEVDVSFLGDASSGLTKRVRLPDVPTPEFGVHAEDAGGISPSANPFRVVALDNTLEVEPDDDHEQATLAKVPGALNGVISAPGDIDCFRFQATKGQTFDVQLYGRRLRTPLDSVVDVFHRGGGRIAGNDDARGLDSYFRFTAPESKEYAIRIRDHLGKGGPDYVYRVEIAPVHPRLTLGIPQVRQYSQERQAISVARGNRYAALISASREDFSGDLVISAEGFPEGIGFQCESMPSNLNVVPAVFEAAADAPLAGALCQLSGRHADPEQKIRGGFHQRAELLIGNPGQSLYWKRDVHRLAVAVTQEVPFKIRIVEPGVPLIQNGVMDLKVAAERSEGFDGAIGLEMVFHPPGVSAARGATIPKGKTEATIRLNASGNAQVRSWKIAVNGSARVGEGTVWASSQLGSLRVAPPYVTIALESSSVEQGKETELVGKVSHHTPFEGKAKIRLLGLPHKVVSEDLEIDKGAAEVVFPVKTDPTSPPGRHRGVFCQVTIVEKGEPLVHSTGGTELRIDKPLPPPRKPPPKSKVATPEKAAPKKPAKEATKRLTRLEKLRQEYAKRLQEQ